LRNNRRHAKNAVKQLLRVCLTDEHLADELLPQILGSRACEGLLGEQVIRKLAELREAGARLDLTSFAEMLPAEERRLVYDSLFWSGETPDREGALGYIRALRLRKVQRESEKLLMDIQSAVGTHEFDKLTDLQKAKQNLDKELRELLRPEKKLTNERTD
jgi:hypothetical protein